MYPRKGQDNDRVSGMRLCRSYCGEWHGVDGCRPPCAGRLVRMRSGYAPLGIGGGLGMKVRVAFTVEVDADKWADAYGIETDQVRADVNAYVYHGFLSYLTENDFGPDPYDR